MTVINSFSPAIQQNAVAFTSNDQLKKHSVAAVASAILPGSGQLIKGEKKSGLARLGLEAGILGSILIAAKKLPKTFGDNLVNAKQLKPGKEQLKTLFKDFSKTKIAGVAALAAVPVIALAANHISAVKDAYNPKNK